MSSYRCVHTGCATGWQREDGAGSEDYLCSTCRPEEGQTNPDRPEASPTVSVSLPTDHHDAHSPVPAQSVSSEPPQRPTSPECPSLPAELHHSPSPPQQDPTDPCDAPCQAESTAVPHSSAVPHVGPPNLSHQSEPAADVLSFQAPPDPDHLVQQLSAPAPAGDAGELQSHPPACQHSPGQQLEDSAPPQPSHPDHDLAASHQDPGEHHHHPAASPQHQTKLQRDSELPQPTKSRHSPAAAEEDLTEFHNSPSPRHLEFQSPKHPQGDAVEPGSSHAASQDELPCNEEPAEAPHSPGSVEHTHQQEQSVSPCSPASPQLPATETQLSSSQPQPDPPDLPHSPAAPPRPTKLLHSPEPGELLDDVAQGHCDSSEFPRRPEHTELTGSPAAPPAEAMDAPQGRSSPHSEPAKLQTTAVSRKAGPQAKPGSTGHQGDLMGSKSSPAEHPEAPTPAHDHGPADVPESPALLVHAQPSSAQLSPSRNFTEDQLIATTSPPSPVHCSSTLCSDAHSAPSPVELQPTPPADAPYQQSLLLHSPAQVCTSQPALRPTEECGPPPKQETIQVLPRCRDGRSRRGIKQDSPKALSAPCSPSPPQPPTRISVSQPASPVQPQLLLAPPQPAVQAGLMLECTRRRSHEELDWTSIQTGLADQGQTVDHCLAPLRPVPALSTGETEDRPSEKCPPAGSGGPSPGQPSWAPAPPKPTPQSLVHVENRSCFPGEETVPPPPQSPCGSFSHCTPSNGLVQKSSPSPQPSSQMPTLSASACVLTAGPSPADGSSARPSSLLDSPRAVTPRPTDLHLFQSCEGVAAHHPRPSAEPEMSQLTSSPDTLDHVSIFSKAARTSDAPGDPVHAQEMVCGSAEDSQTDVSPTSFARPSHAPGLTPTLTSCRSSPCNHTLSTTGQGSPLHVENTSKSSPPSPPTTQSSLAQTTADVPSSPHRLAQASETCCGPHRGPGPNTEIRPGPASSLNLDMGASLSMLGSFLPDLLHLESGPNKPDNVGEMIPQPVGSSLSDSSSVSGPSPESAPHSPPALEPCVAKGQPSSGSSSPPCLGSTEAAPSPRSPASPCPSQVIRSKPSCSNSPEAPACAQAGSPHAGTSSPADTQVHASPGSSPPEEPPSAGPGGPVLRCLAALTQKVPAQREPAAAEGECQEEAKWPCWLLSTGLRFSFWSSRRSQVGR